MRSASISTCGTPGMNETTAPMATRLTGADQPSLPLKPVTATVTTTNETIQMIVPIAPESATCSF